MPSALRKGEKALLPLGKGAAANLAAGGRSFTLSVAGATVVPCLPPQSRNFGSRLLAVRHKHLLKPCQTVTFRGRIGYTGHPR